MAQTRIPPKEGGGEENFIGMIERTQSVFSSNLPTKIGPGAFYSNQTLTEINFPNVSFVDRTAFSACKNLTTINMPNLLSTEYGAFQDCIVLKNLSIENIEHIGNLTFTRCYNLSEVSLSKVSYIGLEAFAQCSKLVRVSFPNITELSSGTFNYCSSLRYVTIPNVSKIGPNCFRRTAITYFTAPLNLVAISSYAFQSCSGLNTIKLGNELCSLENSNAFSGTGITSTAGSILVPASLYESYKTRTQWSYFKNRIFSY